MSDLNYSPIIQLILTPIIPIIVLKKGRKALFCCVRLFGCQKNRTHKPRIPECLALNCGRGMMNWDTTKIIAIYAAVLSSIVFLWDIFKWRSAGPKLLFIVLSGMKNANSLRLQDKTVITATVSNTGDRPTTITTMGFIHYSSWWSYIRKKPDRAMVVVHPNEYDRLPVVLKLGEIWRGFNEQDSEMVEMAAKGRLYCYISLSHTVELVKRRVRISQ